MSTFELPVIEQGPPAAIPPTLRADAWLRAARHAKLLAWASLAWMCVEGFVGVLAGVQAHSLGVVTWAASSFVEALASLIVVWRFTGHRTLSATSEARAQRYVAASFFLLAPFFVIEAVRKLLSGGDTHVTALAVALTASAIVLMPLLGWAKLRLGKQLDSGATAGEGIQNIMCAVQAATALIAVAAAGIGIGILDPIAALAIAGIALKEGREGWQGHDTCCTPMPGLNAMSPAVDADGCQEDCCALAMAGDHDPADHPQGGGGHAGHAQGVSADADTGKLSIALGLIVGFMAVEVAVGVLAHSLALLSDAGHMLTDAAAIGFSLFAARLAARPAKGAMTYGLKRVKILSATASPS